MPLVAQNRAEAIACHSLLIETQERNAVPRKYSHKFNIYGTRSFIKFSADLLTVSVAVYHCAIVDEVSSRGGTLGLLDLLTERHEAQSNKCNDRPVYDGTAQ